MPDLADVPEMSRERPAVGDDARADSRVTGELDEVRRTGVGAVEVLGQHAQRRVVVDRHRDVGPSERLRELGPQWYVPPAESGGEYDGAVAIDQAGYADRDAEDLPAGGTARS